VITDLILGIRNFFENLKSEKILCKVDFGGDMKVWRGLHVPAPEHSDFGTEAEMRECGLESGESCSVSSVSQQVTEPRSYSG
jgi:hypothetical protein